MIAAVLGFIPGKWKFYALIILAVILGMFGFSQMRVNSALNKQRARDTKRRLDAMKEKKVIENEVDSLSDDDLIAGVMRNKR